MQDLPVCTERLDAGAMSLISFNPAQFYVAMAPLCGLECCLSFSSNQEAQLGSSSVGPFDSNFLYVYIYPFKPSFMELWTWVLIVDQLEMGIP